MPPQKKKIVGGFLAVKGAQGGPTFHLFGKDWLLTNKMGDTGNVPLQSQCLGLMGCPPATYSAGSNFAGELGLDDGFAMIGLKKFAKLYYTGQLDFVGKVKLTSTMPEQLTTVVPFTMTGNLQGYKNNPFVGDPGPKVFDWTVSGQGRAVLSMTSKLVKGVRRFTFFELRYHFLT